MSTMFWVWAGIIVLAVIIEIATTDLISIWFGFGAIPSFILSAVNVPPIWQVVVFVILSAVLLATLRKVTKKLLLKNTDTKTNAQSLVGQKYRLISRTDFETVGSVKINGVEWSALGDKQQTIEEGKIVEIVEIAGNKLLVKEVEE